MSQNCPILLVNVAHISPIFIELTLTLSLTLNSPKKNNKNPPFSLLILFFLIIVKKNLKFGVKMAGNGVFAEIIDGEVYKYYCEGEWKKSASGKSVAIINPTTRKTQYKVQGMLFLEK